MNGGPWLVQNRLGSESSEFEPIDFTSYFTSSGLHLYVADCMSRSGLDETLERRWGKKIAAKGVYRDIRCVPPMKTS